VTRHVFVAGTGTAVGKTFVTCAILRYLTNAGRRAIGMKPVAAGAESVDGAMKNTDALALLAHSNPQPRYEDINPWLLEQATSPDIAGRLSGIDITLAPIGDAFGVCAGLADVVLVEGIGGWRVPLSGALQTADLVRYLDLPVILVSGIHLGCINHTLLTAEVIIADGIELLGWVANVIDPSYAFQAESIATLIARMPAPLLGVCAWRENADTDMIEPQLAAGLRRVWP